MSSGSLAPPTTSRRNYDEPDLISFAADASRTNAPDDGLVIARPPVVREKDETHANFVQMVDKMYPNAATSPYGYSSAMVSPLANNMNSASMQLVPYSGAQPSQNDKTPLTQDQLAKLYNMSYAVQPRPPGPSAYNPAFSQYGYQPQPTGTFVNQQYQPATYMPQNAIYTPSPPTASIHPAPSSDTMFNMNSYKMTTQPLPSTSPSLALTVHNQIQQSVLPSPTFPTASGSGTNFGPMVCFAMQFLMKEIPELILFFRSRFPHLVLMSRRTNPNKLSTIRHQRLPQAKQQAVLYRDDETQNNWETI